MINSDPKVVIRDVSSALSQSVAKVVVGQDQAVEDLTIGLWTGSHVLLEGLPGLAKTTLVHALASALGLSYRRIQFTPDLMPADIIGMEIMDEDQGHRSMRFVEGPIFTQILLADEINRTPPKTQSALLQAMQEGQVSIAGKNIDLPRPFIVFATQNPIENEGTYPLPEAQLDRFSLKVVMGYPNFEEELKISVGPQRLARINPIEGILQIDWEVCSQYLENMPVTQTIMETAVKMVRMSRPDGPDSDEMIRSNVRWGAGPRASQYLIRVAKARAAMGGRSTPDLDDLEKSALPVLRHRILPTFSAEARHIHSEEIIAHLLRRVRS